VCVLVRVCECVCVCSGGGRRIERVDVSVDGGETWTFATLKHPVQQGDQRVCVCECVRVCVCMCECVCVCLCLCV